MLTKEFSYTLPEDLIAQSPLECRDSSRLLCVSRSSDVFRHMHFCDLPELLMPGDCLVLNDSRVLPARLIGIRSTGGAVEVLLLRKYSVIAATIWECLVRPGSKVRAGTKLTFGDGELTAAVTDVLPSGNRIIEFTCAEADFNQCIARLGKMPLPPYIHETLQDPERYQTVYSHTPGSAAAPTAGLHFTHELLASLKEKSIETAYITLHVGLGTFRPVKADRIEDHLMHSEQYFVSKEAAEQISRAKDNGRRVIAVGTTACRTLEAIADSSGHIKAVSGETDIFIYPGYKFKCIDGLITNFHLPESTLIILVSAFAGRERTLAAYHEAIERGYRFYSFGDAMLIIDN